MNETIQIDFVSNPRTGRKCRVLINEDGMTVFIFDPHVGPWVDVPEKCQRQILAALKEKFEQGDEQ